MHFIGFVIFKDIRSLADLLDLSRATLYHSLHSGTEQRKKTANSSQIMANERLASVELDAAGCTGRFVTWQRAL